MKKKRVGVTRAKAEELIKGLIERAKAVDADPQYLYGIARMAIFGSYLTDKPKLGDIDVAVELGPKERDADRHWKRTEEQRDAEVPESYSFLDGLIFPEMKVLRAPRNRHKSFSLHEWSELELLQKKYETTAVEIYRNEAVRP